MKKPQVDLAIGLEKVLSTPGLTSNWGTCGLLSNQASVDRKFNPAWKLLKEVLGQRLTCLFGPQHGFYGTVQDNMIETQHTTHQATGLPIFSLYSETRQPSAEMVSHFDTLVIDLQIVGCRVYTFKWTVLACLKAAKKHHRRVVILDRPNPLGGIWVEGLVLEKDVHSFVGDYALPMRHGLTMGEFAKLVNADIDAELEIITLEHWDPTQMQPEWRRPWVMTSPNLPHPEPLFIYPGLVALEGTNLSEGRGTALPFQLIGAPYLANADDYLTLVLDLLGKKTPGLYLRPVEFMPTYHKGQGLVCRGIQVHVLDPTKVSSFRLGLTLMRAAYELNPKDFAWKAPGYEYNFDELPINLILGSSRASKELTAETFDLNAPLWSKGLKGYINNVAPFLLYERQMFTSDIT